MTVSTTQRITTVAACTGVQLLLGSIYAWSVIAGSLESSGGLMAWQTQFVFGATITIFACMTLPAGRWVQRYGARPVAMLGAALYGTGQYVAGLNGADLVVMLVGMSFIAAVGAACTYMAAIVACTSCFPQRRGTVTGIAVAGFGGGAILHSRIAEWLLLSGHAATDVIQLTGGMAGALAMVIALAICPPRLLDTGAVALTLRQLIAAPRFRVAAAGMFCGCFGGLLLVGSLRQMGADGGLSGAATLHAISAFAAGNIIGRLAWGWVFDRFAFAVIPANLLLAAAAAMLISWCMSSSVGFAASAGLAGLAFGGNFSLYAAYLANAFGAERLARTYPFVFMCYGVAALLGPTAGGALRDLTGSSLAGGVLASAMAVIGAMVVGLMHARAARPKLAPKAVRRSPRSREMAQVG